MRPLTAAARQHVALFIVRKTLASTDAPGGRAPTIPIGRSNLMQATAQEARRHDRVR